MLRWRFPRRARARPLVLVYHRVAASGDGVSGLSVTPEHFEQQLEVLSRRFAPLPLCELLEARPGGGRPPVAITFDDGYADNLHEALPRLRRFGIPATLFVASGMLGEGREFWWDRLERLLVHDAALPAALPDSAGGGAIGSAASGDDAAARGELFWKLQRRLLSLEPERREACLGEIACWAGVAPDPDVRHRTLTEAELRRLAEDDLWEVGAHTVTHPLLASLPRERQRAEICDGKRALESLLGREVESFAYPFGESDAFDAESVALVREAGFRHAFTGERGTLGPETDRFRIPRCAARSWDGEKFARRVSRWSRR